MHQTFALTPQEFQWAPLQPLAIPDNLHIFSPNASLLLQPVKRKTNNFHGDEMLNWMSDICPFVNGILSGKKMDCNVLPQETESHVIHIKMFYKLKIWPASFCVFITPYLRSKKWTAMFFPKKLKVMSYILKCSTNWKFGQQAFVFS